MSKSASPRSFVVNKSTSLPFAISREIKEGRVLAGDDLTVQQLTKWFAQEQEAFYEGDAGNSEIDPWYAYMRFLNVKLGFSKINYAADSPRSILFLGPGSGIEIEMFAKENPTWAFNFLEASVSFKAKLRKKFPHSVIVEPRTSGDIELGDNSQNVVCAFSVLHHIPNVSHVVREVYRVTKPNGLFLVREPCSSMGDWRFPRSATPNERGISRRFLADVAKVSGFELATKPVPIIFNPLNRILKRTGLFYLMSFNLIYRIDRFVSSLVALNDYYWRDTWFKKLGPSAYFYVFRKPKAMK